MNNIKETNLIQAFFYVNKKQPVSVAIDYVIT